jgi:hypothetical protein
MIPRSPEDARSALECGSASYRLVSADGKAAAPLRFAAALQGASRIFTHSRERRPMGTGARNDKLPSAYSFLSPESRVLAPES